MGPSTPRRVLPALAFLLGLSVLTLLVWWRVIHRSSATTQASPAPSTCVTPAPGTVLPKPSSVKVRVRNGTDRTGLAARVAESLRKEGFVVPDIGNTDNPVAGVAEIRFDARSRAAAQLLNFYLPGAALVPTPGRPGNDLELRLGSRFTAVATPAQVKTAMAAAHVRIGTPAPAASAPC